MNIRRLSSLSLFIFAVALLSGCSQKPADQTASTVTSDSLLASSPIEPAQGQLQPSTDFQPQTSPGTTPTPTPTPTQQAPKSTPTPKPKPAPPAAPSATVAAGTGVKVTMTSSLTSETAQVGQEWSGAVSEAVTVGNMAPFPAGSTVHGVVDGVLSAERGSRAVLVLRVTSIEANGRSHSISATADSIIAGSTRARNVGAVAGGAAAGALIGRAVGGSGKGALIGGILGGAAATGAVAKSKGYQATVKEGSEITFRVDHDTKLKL
jgi:hypothetical protein